MAEARRFADLKYGRAGRLTYIPEDIAKNGTGIGVLDTTRCVSNLPHFKFLGTSAELYSASNFNPQQHHSPHLAIERSLHRRWLLKSHPEAFMGDPVISGLLNENIEHFRKWDFNVGPCPLLTVGEMTDWTMPSKPTGVPVLATATGGSGEFLRLSRIEDSKWKWDDDDDSTLQLSVIDPADQVEEVIWESDGLPISQIKYVTNTPSRQDPIRWIIVQKETSTVILQPGYKAISTAEVQQPSVIQRQSPSRIDPNPILTLTHRDTGGNAHVDVTFNPSKDGLPPQICIIDECGYWTLWNILGRYAHSKNTLRFSLHMCGHIFEGSLSKIPSLSPYPAERHGVLFVGGTDVADSASDPFADFGEEQNAVQRSDYLVLWNSERFEIVHLATNTLMPRISNFSTTKSNFGQIVDVQISPLNRRHMFILTELHVVWIDIFCLDPDTEETFLPSILLTSRHSLSSHERLRMHIGQNTNNEQDNVMMTIYASQSHQAELIWFTLSPDHGLPHWHSQIVMLPLNEKGEYNLQTILLQQAPLSSSPRGKGVGSSYQKHGCQFYQVMILGQDLSVKYCMCLTAPDPSLEVTLPTSRLNWTQIDRHRRWRRKRLKLLRHMGEKFVIPDSMSYIDSQVLGSQSLVRDDRLTETSQDVNSHNQQGNMRLKFDYFVQMMRSAIFAADTRQGTATLSISLMDRIQGAIQHARFSGLLPLVTWLEISGDIQTGEEDESSFEGSYQNALETILAGSGDETIVTQLERGSSNELQNSIGSISQIQDYLSSVWLEPVEEKMEDEDVRLRRDWLASLSKDLFLATHGVCVQDVALFGPGPTPNTEEGPSQSTAIPSSSPFPSSVISSSPISSSQTTSTNDAFQRLRLLAPSLQPTKLGALKPAAVLSHWPIERGVDTRNYISSVSIAAESKHDEAKERLRKIEARRKSMAERYRLPPSSVRREQSQTPAGPSQRSDVSSGTPRRPAAAAAAAHTQAMSSQEIPASSQSQGPPAFTMSQPVSGVFGDRKKSKKPKKKSGFR